MARMGLQNGKNVIGVSILLVIVFILLIQCGQPKEMKYFSPSKEQIEKFSKEQNIKVLAMKEVDKRFTILFYAQGRELGNYFITLDDQGKFKFQKTLSKSFEGDEKLDVIGVNSGIPYRYILIQDEELLHEGGRNSIRIQS